MLMINLNGLLLGLVLAVPALAIAVESEDEYRVKAAFLFNFARFVEWPAQLKQLNLCVLGRSPFDRVAGALADKTVDNRPLRLKNITRPIGDCQLLFIANSEGEQVQAILRELNHKPILTIGDTSGFASRGVMFNFFFDSQQRVRFEVNAAAIRESGLAVSSKLLKLGRPVDMVGAP